MTRIRMLIAVVLLSSISLVLDLTAQQTLDMHGEGELQISIVDAFGEPVKGLKVVLSEIKPISNEKIREVPVSSKIVYGLYRIDVTGIGFRPFSQVFRLDQKYFHLLACMRLASIGGAPLAIKQFELPIPLAQNECRQAVLVPMYSDSTSTRPRILELRKQSVLLDDVPIGRYFVGLISGSKLCGQFAVDVNMQTAEIIVTK